MSGLLMVGIVLSAPAAAALGDTGTPRVETGDTADTEVPEPHTGEIGETGGPIFTIPTADTGAPFCDTCVGAGPLAGEEGGSPCQQGCSTSGSAAALWLGLVPLALARRRQSRSYST